MSVARRVGASFRGRATGSRGRSGRREVGSGLRGSVSRAAWVGAVLVAWTAMAACGPVGGGSGATEASRSRRGELSRESIGSAPTPRPLRPEEFGEAYRRARCRHAARCEGHGTASWSTGEWCHPRSVEVTASWPEIPRFDGTCEPEWFDYSPELARRCIEAVESADCKLDYGEPDLLCHDVFLRHRPSFGSCGPHRCPEGELCTIIGSCTDPPCRLACRPPLREGEACLQAASPWPDDCAEGLRCVGSGAASSPGTCERLRGLGESCGARAWCLPDLACNGSVCEPSVGIRGGVCELECRGDDICALQRDGQRRCVAGAARGAPCTPRCRRDEVCDPPPCAPGARCVEGVCVPTVHEGEACGAQAVCILSFHCEAGRCVPDPVDGEPCSDAVPCARGICVGGRCRLRSPGEPCGFGSQAPLGECPAGIDGCDSVTRTCATPLRAGEPCDGEPLACMPGLTCRGTCEVDGCWCRGVCTPLPGASRALDGLARPAPG